MTRLSWLLLLAAPLSAQTYSPQPINFGAVKIGQVSATMSSTLTNTGTDTLKFPGGSSMAGSPAFKWVADNCGGRALAVGGTCVLQYRFAPTQTGPLTGANLVGTNHGLFPVLFTGIGQDTIPVQPAGPVIAGVRTSDVSVTVQVGTAPEVTATAADSLGQPVASPITWAIANPGVATVIFPFTGVSQVVAVRGLSTGSTTITARAGGKMATMGVTVIPAAPAPDTTPVSLTMTGLQVVNVPSKWTFTFPPLPLWTGPYRVNIIGTASDTVGKATCSVLRP